MLLYRTCTCCCCCCCCCTAVHVVTCTLKSCLGARGAFAHGNLAFSCIQRVARRGAPDDTLRLACPFRRGKYKSFSSHFLLCLLGRLPRFVEMAKVCQPRQSLLPAWIPGRMIAKSGPGMESARIILPSCSKGAAHPVSNVSPKVATTRMRPAHSGQRMANVAETKSSCLLHVHSRAMSAMSTSSLRASGTPHSVLPRSREP